MEEKGKKKIINTKSVIISAIIIVLVIAFVVYLRADSKNKKYAKAPERTTMNANISTVPDQDHDGYPDSKDLHPTVKDVGIRDLAIFASLAYDDGSNYVCNDTVKHDECIYPSAKVKGFNGVKIGQTYY